MDVYILDRAGCRNAGNSISIFEKVMDVIVKTPGITDNSANASVLLRRDIADFKDDLSEQIREAKADFIKWMFILSIAQVLVMAAIVFIFLK